MGILSFVTDYFKLEKYIFMEKFIAPYYDHEAKDKLEEAGFYTAPFDARFPNQRNTKACWQNFIDYHRCVEAKGEEFEPCDFFKDNYESICPNFWAERMQDGVEEGNFPGMSKIFPKTDAHH